VIQTADSWITPGGECSWKELVRLSLLGINILRIAKKHLSWDFGRDSLHCARGVGVQVRDMAYNFDDVSEIILAHYPLLTWVHAFEADGSEMDLPSVESKSARAIQTISRLNYSIVLSFECSMAYSDCNLPMPLHTSLTLYQPY
jgi:hypothetical protein